MNEVRTPMQAVKVMYPCPKCKKGFLQVASAALQSDPPQYPSLCTNDKCKHGENLLAIYPRIELEEIKSNVNPGEPGMYTIRNEAVRKKLTS
jgi:hypothetical protein